MIINYLKKQLFKPSLLGLFINPFFFARRGLYNAIVQNATYISGKTLDVGCGQKPYQHLFKTTEYIGLDIEVSGHNHTDSKVDVFYDGKIMPFESASFDSVISNQVLEHVFNPYDFLKEINRVLKTGGYVFIAENTSNYQDVHYWNYRSKELYIDLFKSFEIIQADNYIEALEDISMFIMKKRG